MKNTIDRIKQQMKNASSSHNLPQAYPEDLDMDFNDLPKYLEQGIEVVWLLRTYGTVMVPAGIGAHPGYITNWLWGDHGQQIKAFHISTEGVRPVSHDEAEALIMRPPAKITSFDSVETLRETVDLVLRRATDLKIWGMWDAVRLEQFSSLAKWHSYFVQAGNVVMSDFTARALRYIQSKQGQSYGHAA